MQIKQIIADNGLNSVADIYKLLRNSFKDTTQRLMETQLDTFFSYETSHKGGIPISNGMNIPLAL